MISNQADIEQVIHRLNAPFFFYDLNGLEAHLSELSAHLDDGIKLWYACKANPISAILKIFRNLGFGIDFASQGELDQILNSGIRPSNLISTGPGKSLDYLRSLMKAGVEYIVIESINQLKWLDQAAQETGMTPKVLLRLQLDWDDGESVLGGNSVTPFGIDSKQWMRIDLKQFSHLQVKGCHVFQWGNILEADKLESIWRRSIEESIALSKGMNFELEIMDLGGGLGVSYGGLQKELNFNEALSHLKDLKKEFSIPFVWMELGRFAVAPFGQYACKVLDRKHVRGKEVLVLQGGINHLARPALTQSYFPCQSLTQGASSKEFQVHGPLCTALDYMGSFDLPESIDVDDWLIFDKVGAYGFTESMPYFLCHELPGEVIKYKNDIVTPRPPRKSNEWMI